jgi:hypothetical protein
MASNKKEHSLYIKVADGNVSAKVQGDAVPLINSIIDCMDEDGTFEQLLTTAVSIFQFRKMVRENTERMKQLHESLNKQL